MARTTTEAPLALDTKGAARLLGVSTSLLEHLRMTPERSPKFLRIGSRIIYRVVDLEEFAADRAHGGQP